MKTGPAGHDILAKRALKKSIKSILCAYLIFHIYMLDTSI